MLDTVELSADLSALVEQLADLLAQATSPGTRRAYATDWADFADWAGRHRLPPLPAESRTVALYVASAIAVAYREAALPSPTGHELVRRAVAGPRRKHGARPAGKTALVTAPLVTICGRLHTAETLPWRLTAAAADLAGQPGGAAERRRLAGQLRAARATALRA